MAPSETVNQLVIATVAGEQAGELIQRLTQSGFQVTRVARGDFLQEIPVSVLIGLERNQLPEVLKQIRECCQTRRRFIPAQAETPWLESLGMMIEAEVGGATVYVLDVERFEQI
jgi:uncharacterized protein YaaQ